MLLPFVNDDPMELLSFPVESRRDFEGTERNQSFIYGQWQGALSRWLSSVGQQTALVRDFCLFFL